MDCSSVPSEDASRPTGDMADVMAEIRSLATLMKAKVRPLRPRFPYLCKNGACCPFLACGTCWFSHDADAKSPKTINTNDAENEKLQHQLDKKLAAMQSTIDRKMTDFAKYVDTRFSEVDAKLEAMAEAFIKDEADVPSLHEKSLSPNGDAAELSGAQVQAVKFDIMKDLSETFQNGVRLSFEAFGKIIEARMAKIESKIGLAAPVPSAPPLDGNT
jgi:hypothetical protein